MLCKCLSKTIHRTQKSFERLCLLQLGEKTAKLDAICFCSWDNETCLIKTWTSSRWRIENWHLARNLKESLARTSRRRLRHTRITSKRQHNKDKQLLSYTKCCEGTVPHQNGALMSEANENILWLLLLNSWKFSEKSVKCAKHGHRVICVVALSNYYCVKITFDRNIATFCDRGCTNCDLTSIKHFCTFKFRICVILRHLRL